METVFKNIEAKFLAADERIEYGEVREAKDMLEEIIMDEPTYGRAHNHLGWIYLTKLDDFARAERHLKLAMRYAPAYPGGYKNYAHLLYAVGKFEELREHASQTMEDIAGTDKAMMNRFVALTQETSGEMSKAKKTFINARNIAVDTEFVEAINEDLKRLRRKMGWVKWLLA